MRSSGVDGAASTEQAPDHRATRLLSLSFRTFVFWGAGVAALILAVGYQVGALVRLVPFLVFLPAVVAGVGAVWQTAAVSVWILLVAAVTFTLRGGIDVTDAYSLLLAAAFGALSTAACWYRIRHGEETARRRSHEDEVRRLRSTVAELQRRILRPLPARAGGVVVDGRYRPVEEDRMVGGDVYEVVDSPHGVRVLIADVQGKGLPAIGTAFSVLGAFRSTAYRTKDIRELVDAMEDAVVQYNFHAQQIEEPERFVTALILDIDEQAKVCAVNCGHIPPYLVRPGRTGPVALSEPGAPLGLGGLVPEPRALGEFALPPDGALLLCTDGVTEARDRGGAFYPLEERLRGWEDVPSERVIETLAADLRRFTGDHFRDDVTALTLYREGATAVGGRQPVG
ncbi:serine/threonine-protein phosphatase [Thermobifida halotolerans]|uniref:Serine/threonine-protein phosphatase n=1 Tax=Thermobifida halotolerans TaxID=483545 RepID=A0A399G9F8_9ACTN|nr:PP2C family protein-serine/threonine phosphatase [Thermobifida halotolerans]UOE18559.1 serine/threonine-protein phosphatase [Thermobifida halotolerans]